jgi:hypothetical protein
VFQATGREQNVTRLSTVGSSVRNTRLKAQRIGVVGWLWLVALALAAAILGLHLTS